jgi:hypothetical protein
MRQGDDSTVCDYEEAGCDSIFLRASDLIIDALNASMFTVGRLQGLERFGAHYLESVFN